MLYPPIALYLFVPFTVLPAVLWWVIPIGIVTCHVVSARPAWWAWPLIAFALFLPRAQHILILGNTAMWVTALVALGLRYAWVSPFVLLKPTFLPCPHRHPQASVVGWVCSALLGEPRDAAALA